VLLVCGTSGRETAGCLYIKYQRRLNSPVSSNEAFMSNQGINIDDVKATRDSIIEHLTTLFRRVPDEYPGGKIEGHREQSGKWSNGFFDATL